VGPGKITKLVAAAEIPYAGSAVAAGELTGVSTGLLGGFALKIIV
jgi:hypothetical protein